jgi:hypothetical protein
LNDAAFNQDPANTAAGISGAGPTPGIGLNSFYGPWLERVGVSLGRRFSSGEGEALQLQVQAFKLLNQANFYVRNGDGINQLQYTRLGPTAARGRIESDLLPGAELGPGNLGSLREISPNGLPRRLQVSAGFMF